MNRERESQGGSALSAQSLTQGSIPRTMRSWPEPKSRVGHLTNGANPGAPEVVWIFLKKYLVKFTTEGIWSWTFLCWEIFYYWFNFFTHIISLLRFYISSLVSFDNLCVSKKMSPFHLDYLGQLWWWWWRWWWWC